MVLISGDGAFLSGGLSIEAAFQENHPIVVVVDNNGGLDCISQQQERLFKNGITSQQIFGIYHFIQCLRASVDTVSWYKKGGNYSSRKTRNCSGKTACVNVKAKGVISPIVLATTSKRDKASIE